ncbi:hypothetical protein Scep_028509 [Stephania cephalantha]|uniref:Uncharacterized protein n=1 Tax=Stephania cephalantha TaxID=152367 RepID=A0AAP0HLW2_9MAGN
MDKHEILYRSLAGLLTWAQFLYILYLLSSDDILGSTIRLPNSLIFLLSYVLVASAKFVNLE